MPRVTKPNAPALHEVTADLAAAVVAANPRGAPITLPEPPCVLDGQPINSTLTVFQDNVTTGPMVMTPRGEVPVPTDDYSRSLPVLAEIKRIGETQYRARQLNSGLDQPDLICDSARACIQQFKRHFHNARD